MKRKSLIAAWALTVLPAFTASAATTFSFQFNSVQFIVPGGTFTPPGEIGGTFVSGTDLSPGTYDLSSLGYFSVEFSVGAPPELAFSNNDIVTPLDQVAVKIAPFAPGVESLVFVPTCCDDGIYTALEFTINVSDLGPEPGYVQYSLLFNASPDGENSFYEVLSPGGLGFGYYLALSPVVPEPPTWTMLLLGFAGLGFVGYRQAKRASFQEVRQGAACNVPSHDPQRPPSVLKRPDRKVDVRLGQRR